MKVALLTAHNRVSPVFVTSLTWLLIEATPEQCKVSDSYHFNTHDELEMVNELLKENIEIIICGALPYYLEKILINQGCEVFAFTAGDINEITEALHLNQLDSAKFRMPGCQKRKRRGRNNFFCKNTANQSLSALNEKGK